MARSLNNKPSGLPSEKQHNQIKLVLNKEEVDYLKEKWQLSYTDVIHLSVTIFYNFTRLLESESKSDNELSKMLREIMEKNKK